MHLLLALSLFLTSIVVRVFGYTIPDVDVVLLSPKGFSLSIPDEEGITDVYFYVKIDQPITLYQTGDFSAVITESTGGKWVFDNINTSVRPGSKINYWIHVKFGQYGKNYRDVGTVTLSEHTPVTILSCSPVLQSTATECLNGSQPTCHPSITTVRGKPACKGELIFEDDFNVPDMSHKWSGEIRIPLASDDGQFVSFQNRLENGYVTHGNMILTPSLLTSALDMEYDTPRSGLLNLTARCTAIVDRKNECERRAQYYQILPPVLSARVRTRNFFSFRYGRIEIRAKLPRGDWLFPLLLLEPLENFYGVTGYASGQMRIAFNYGNEILMDENRRLDNAVVHGGVIMTNDEKMRRKYLRFKNTGNDLSQDFHTYSLTWTDQSITLAIDGATYGTISEYFPEVQAELHGNTNHKNRMAPFDREFYVTLGLAVGGHAEFPDTVQNGINAKPKPWKNGDPKAELHFWKDRNNWFETWDSEGSAMYIDYVKVFAL